MKVTLILEQLKSSKIFAKLARLASSVSSEAPKYENYTFQRRSRTPFTKCTYYAHILSRMTAQR